MSPIRPLSATLLATILLAPVARADDQAKTQAAAVLDRAEKAYRTPAALVEKMTVEIAMPGDPGAEPQIQRSEHELRLGAGVDASLAMDGGVRAVSLGGRFMLEFEGEPKYVDRELDHDLRTTFHGTLMSDAFLPLGLYARGGVERELWVRALSLGLLTEPEIAGVADVEHEGRTCPQIEVRGTDGTALARFDPGSARLEEVKVHLVPEGAPPEFKVDVVVRFKGETRESADGLITFDAGERKAVASLQDMEDPPLQIGSDAPSFTLAQLDGDPVTLADLRGSVVVIDFWATWCGPCRKGLPVLHEFAKGVADRGLPVRVFAVNVWEQADSPEARVELVRKFWKEQGFTIPVLLDHDNAVVGAYGVGGIPTMFVIDPQGRVAHSHVGFDPNVAKELDEVVDRLLAGG